MPEDGSESDSADRASLYQSQRLIHVIRKQETISEENRIEKVEKCLTNGAKIDTKDENGNTALHVAVKRGYLKIVKFLVGKGAKTDICNLKNQTALTLAEARTNKDILYALRELVGRGSHLASQQIASTSQATLSTDPTASISKNHPAIKSHRGSSKREATGDDEDSKNSKMRRLHTAEEAEAEPSSENDSPFEANDINERTVDHRPTSPSPFDGSNTYAARQGLKNALHGNMYQLKLLMLFFLRGLRLRYLFRLATEMDRGEKFDDLVFQYKAEPESETFYRFLQAKHRQNENEKISARDLLTEKETDNDFSLQKYFISYRKIKNDPEFNKRPLDFTIFTNIGFNLTESESAEIGLKKVHDRDVFLKFKSVKKLPARYKFLIKKDSKLWNTLKRSADVHKLANVLVKHVYESKDITLKNDLFKRYHIALAQEVIDVNTKEFFSNFIHGENLSRNGKKFWEIFCAEASVQFAKELKKDPDAIWKKIPLKVSSTFGRLIESSTDPMVNSLAGFSEELVKLINSADKDYLVEVDDKKYKEDAEAGSRERVFADNVNKLDGHMLIRNDKKIRFRCQFLRDTKLPDQLEHLRNSLKTGLGKKYKDLSKYQFKMPKYFKISDEDLPGDEVTDEEINDFFSKLIFAVNQPNEAELGKPISSELGTGNWSNLLTVDLFGAVCQKKMLDWFKEKGPKGEEGRFYTDKDAKNLIKEIQEKVEGVANLGLSLSYRKELEGYGIEFAEKNQKLEKFLKSGFSDGAKSTLNLIAALDTLPTAIRVQQTIQQSDSYKKDISLVMFLRLRTLQSADIEERVTLAFRSLHSHHLLVIDCGSATEPVVQELYSRLSLVMSQTKKKNVKKLIFITRSGMSFKNGHEIRDDVTFKHLTIRSQLDLINKMVISFQGDQQRTSFKNLMDISGSQDIVMQDLRDAIDTRTLVKLICDEEIKIGSKLRKSEEIKEYYVHRRIEQRVIFKDKICESSSKSDELVLSSSTQNVPRFRGIIRKPGEDAERYFKYRCKRTSANVHWLEYVSGKFIWCQSRGDITFLMQYRDVSENQNRFGYHVCDKEGTRYLEDDELANLKYDGQKVFIISDSAGMGKTTLFTHLAKRIKEKNSEHWVIRIDLNDFTRVLEQVVLEISDASDVDKVVEFFVEKLSELKAELDKTILKVMMKNRSKVAPKRMIALLFDGFDEISPLYEDKVIVLLQGLKKVGAAKLFVATRPHMRALLEDKLGIFSYTMRLFSKGDQIEFLIPFWKAKLGPPRVGQQNKKRVRTYAETLVQQLNDQSINRTAEEVASIPLLINMIAEIFLSDEGNKVKIKHSETLQKFLRSDRDKPKLLVNLNKAYLYERFVEKKYYRHITEKNKEDLSKPGVQFTRKQSYKTFLEMHQKIALHTVFNVTTYENSSDTSHPYLLKREEIENINTYMTQISGGQERTGVITHVVNGRVQFIHLTFAEYFAATFIFDCFLVQKGDRKPEVSQFLFREILRLSQYKVIRDFLNGLLSGTSQQSDGRPAGDAAASGASKVDPCEYNYQGEFIFHTAAREGHYEIMKFFLNRIEQPGTRKDLISAQNGFDHRTVLGIVADDRQWNELKWLINNGGAEVNSLISNGGTPLHAAASDDDLDIVQWLVSKGASVDALRDDGMTPLHVAARFGRLTILKWLVNEKKVNVNGKCTNGVTLLHCAALSGKIPVLKYLIKAKRADKHATTDQGETVLLYAASFAEWKVVRFLADTYKIDIECESNNGSTVVSCALHQDNLKAIKWLVNKKDIRINLAVAVQAGSPEIVKWLIKMITYDPYESDDNGYTPALSQAVQDGNSEMLKLLLEEGTADVDGKDEDGNTALHVAAKLKKSEMIYTLINDYNADTQIDDDHGQRPVDLYGPGWYSELLRLGRDGDDMENFREEKCYGESDLEDNYANHVARKLMEKNSGDSDLEEENFGDSDLEEENSGANDLEAQYYCD